MTDFFVNIYSHIGNADNSFLERVRMRSVLRWLVRTTANWILPLYYRLFPSKPLPVSKREHSVVVSLTSFPARIHHVWLTLESLLRQTVPPDEIILWLSREQFADSSDLPIRLQKAQNKGVQIRFCNGDLRSHKKYYYVLDEMPKATLVTVDDDIFYPSTLIQSLWIMHEQHPTAIIASYTHRMLFDEKALLPYKEWEKNTMSCDTDLFFGSGGGTLFPVGSLNEQVTDIDCAMSLCPQGDDIWLNAMARINRTPIVHIGRFVLPLPVLIPHNKALKETNLQDGNDRQLQAIQTYCMKHFRHPAFQPHE